MKKKFLAICSLFISTMLLGGCAQKSDSQKTDVKSYPAKVLEIKSESYPISLEYQGITGGSEVRKLSFKSAAKISKIYVSKGQHVKKGDNLVELDKSDLNFAMEASKAQMEAASAQYDKAINGAQQEDITKAAIAVKNAEDNYNYCKDLYEKSCKLYEAGATAKQQVDDMKIKLDSSESALNAAKQSLQQVQNGSRVEDKQALSAQMNGAKASYDSKVNLLQDASLVAESDGYVVDVLCKEGELQSAGYPVILFRNENQVVTVGLSEEDVKKVQVGSKAQVTIGEEQGSGEIASIVQMADKQSGTYSAEIKLSTTIDNNKFYIGETTKVNINIGEKNSTWIPISSVLNDGEDYVFVVENGRAVKKNVVLGDIYNEKVAVEGVKIGDKLVIEGMKNLKVGYQIITK